MLLYLLWVLSSAEPKLAEVTTGWEHAFEAAEKVVKEVKAGRISREDFDSLVRALCERVFGEAIRIGLEERFKYAFGVELRELVRVGKDRARVEVYGKCARVRLTIGDSIYVEELDLCVEELLKNTKVEVPRKNYLDVRYLDGKHPGRKRITSAVDIVMDPVLSLLAIHIATEFESFLFTPSFITSMLPDSRAGITRTLLKPYLPPSLLGGVLGVDQEYVRLYYALAELLSKNPEVLELVKPLLEELGVSVDVRFESGVYNVYAKTWSGKSLPIAMAPSGVRETLSAVLALLATGEWPELGLLNVFIEEPEAHLHPKAQRALARVIATSVNFGKRVLITTHSDYLVSELNNLILLSRLPEEKLGVLGYSKAEVLSPEKVAAYLVRTEGDKAVVERLHVTEDGIPEEEFSKVAEELLGERSRIYEVLEKL